SLVIAPIARQSRGEAGQCLMELCTRQVVHQLHDRCNLRLARRQSYDLALLVEQFQCLPGELVKRGHLTRPSFGVSRTFGASRVPGSLPMAEVPRCPQAQNLALGMCQLLPQS